ncbi:MAG: DNA polymerase III [Treponema sp.]|nr:DNA polymerase III [Treponema sp.]
MFENVLGQSATAQLTDDIHAGLLPPALLFSGPAASGKGTAALELGRIISCEADAALRAPWGCGCPACARHRLLIHPDLLCLGSRPFSAEIAASAGAFLREAATAREDTSSSHGAAREATRVLFIRAIRKLLARFNPALWEDEPKKGKVALAPLVNSMEENLDEFDVLAASNTAGSADNASGLEKCVNGMVKSAFKLEAEGLSDSIPIDRIRRAAYWGRLAPAGKGKLLVIENADRMQEEARNSLLKLMEEPPPRLTLVLTTSRAGSLLPTMLSRLRPYRFFARDAAVEADVIRRVFRDSRGGTISAYIDSFLPVSGEMLNALAAFFAASVAYKAALLSKRQGRPIAQEAVLLGKFTAPRAEAAELGRPQGHSAAVVLTVLEKADKFEIRPLFSRFLSCLLDNAAASQRVANPPEADLLGSFGGAKTSGGGTDGGSSLPTQAGRYGAAPRMGGSERPAQRGCSEGGVPPLEPSFSFLPSVSYNEVWKKCCAWGESAVSAYRLAPALVLEKLFADLSRALAEL